MSLVVNHQIQAPPTRVWEVLTDPEVLTSGDFGIGRIKGTFAPGAKVKIAAEGPKEQFVPFKVVRYDEPTELSLKFKMLFGIMVIQATVYLEPKDGGTLVELGFGTSGLMGRKMNAKLSKLEPQGKKMLEALAQAAEQPA